MNKLFVFIIGASGVGKTSVVNELRRLNINLSIDFYNFDDIGVPSMEQMIAEYGSPESWQSATLEKWRETLLSIEGRDMIVLEGSFNPLIMEEKINARNIKMKTLYICIYAEKKSRENRLLINRNQPELVTDDMENYSKLLVENTLKLGGEIVNSTKKSINELAIEIIGIMECQKSKINKFIKVSS